MLRPGIVALITLFAHPLLGGLVLDGSFGTHGPLPGPNFMIQANFGKQVGGNLFQSFSQFNLTNTQSATFLGPNTVHNILARVTSGSPSSIDGRISSDIPGANLFLMNPAGVLFGQHAQLDVSGSFAVTTANYLSLVGGGKFNANLGGGDVLTSAPVSAFGFLNSAPAPVSIAGSNSARDSHGNIIPGPGLNIQPQKSFSIVAGNIGMNASTISGPGSRVNLVSVKSPGEVELDATDINTPIDVSQFVAFGTIGLTNLALVETSGPGGGPVFIRGGNLLLNNSQISSETMGASQGGTIDIALVDKLQIANLASIVAETLGAGNAGNLSIDAGSLSIQGTVTPGLFTGITATSQAGAIGNAGNLTINVDHALSILPGGQISASTLSDGNAGNVSIHAGSLSIHGLNHLERASPPFVATGIFANSGGPRSNAAAKGNAGNVTITVDDALSIVANSLIASSTFTHGNAGNLNISAGSLLIDGMVDIANNSTGIASQSQRGATGNAGDITVTVDGAFKIASGSGINAATFTSGQGGDITVHAGSLLIDNTLTDGSPTSLPIDPTRGPIHLLTGITAAANLDTNHPFNGTHGSAGNVTIMVDGALKMLGHAQIFDGTLSSGNGGNLTIEAGSLSIDDTGTDVTSIPPVIPRVRIVDISAETQGSGHGGDMNITVEGALNIVGSGQIAVSTSPLVSPFQVSGDAGDLSIHAGSLSIDGLGMSNVFTGIAATSAAGAIGNAGDVTIDVDHTLSILPGGQISVSTLSDGNAGNLSIHAGSLSIHGLNHLERASPPFVATGIFANSGGPRSNAAAKGNAGNVTITVDDALSIVANSLIASSTFTHGNAGNLNISAGSLLIDGMVDIANNSTGIASQSQRGATGNAGDITVTVDGAFKIASGSGINAATFTSGQGGDITVHAGSLLIDNTLTDGSPTSLPIDPTRGPIDLFTGITAAANLDTNHPFNGTHGSAGDVIITVDGALKMLGHGQIFDGTLSSGNGGNLTIEAGSLSIHDSGTDTTKIPRARMVDISAETQGSGHGGDVNITVEGALNIVGSGQIAVSTSPLVSPFQVSGDAGSLNIQAGSLLIDGLGTPDVFTGIAARSEVDAIGNAGDLTINVDHALNIIGGGQISASTSSEKGNAGSVSVTAESVLVDGVNSQISSTTSDNGNAGDIVVHASDFKIKNQGTITTTSSASGNAGSITVHAGDVKIKDGIIASRATSFGAAGSIDLVSGGTIRLMDHSSVSVSAKVNAGNITLKAPVLVSLINSNIDATAGEIGGNITVDPIALQLKNSTIKADAPLGQGGHIDLFTSFLVGPVKTVTSDGSLLLAFNSSITATGGTANGTVNVTAPSLDLGAELITLPNSVLSAESQLQERCTALLQGDFSSFISIGRGGTEPAPEELQTTF